MVDTPHGYCHCGCGQKTRLAPKTNKTFGWIKGEPIRFINHHQHRGKYNPRWNGGKYNMSKSGYQMTSFPKHPRSGKRGYVMNHILIVEKVLGHYLPNKAVIHHIDGNPQNNQYNNLVVCQNTAYHLFLHQRQRAYNACGNPHWRKCVYCKDYDDLQNMYYNRQGFYYHKPCQNAYQRKRKQSKIKPPTL